MLIKELYLQRYGPVRERHCALEPGFNLLYGVNETGKTLTIDALVKLLLGRGRELKDFEEIKRVDEAPEGYVILEREGGRELKVPEQGTLQDIAALSAAECRNIFVIHNSNLSIARESDFYTGVTDRLTGRRTAEIGDIQKKLCDMADITSTFQFRNVEGVKLRSRLEQARQTAAAAEALHEKLIEEGYDDLEQEQVACDEEIVRIDKELEALDQARRREKYEKGRAALDNLRASRATLDALETYSAEDERRWAEAVRDRQRFTRDKETLLADAAAKEADRKVLRELAKEQQRTLQLAEERKKKVDEEVRPALQNYDQKWSELIGRRSRQGLYRSAFTGACALLGLSLLLGSLVGPLLPFFAVAALFFLAAVVSWLSLSRLSGEGAALELIFERMKTLLSRFGLEISTVEAVRSAVQKMAEEHDALEARVRQLQRDEDILTREIAALREKNLPRLEEELSGAAAVIDEIRRKSGLETLPEYAARLKDKQEAAQAAAKHGSVLESLFGGAPAPDDNANLAAWEPAVAELEPYREAAPGLRYDDRKVSELKNRRQETEEKKRRIAGRLEQYSGELRNIEQQANQALQCGDDYLHCQTAAELEPVRKRLNYFVEENETGREDTRQVIALFDEIAAEERSRVAELFGAGSPVSRYFEDITGGRYEAVLYGQVRGAILVRRRDGAELAAEKLSGGAYDQLYLSVRLALAEKLLQGGKGFFIMDDPFIKSDTARLQRQLQALLQVAAQGWQIIYFSAKEEVPAALRREIKSGKVNNLPLQGIFE